MESSARSVLTFSISGYAANFLQGRLRWEFESHYRKSWRKDSLMWFLRCCTDFAIGLSLNISRLGNRCCTCCLGIWRYFWWPSQSSRNPHNGRPPSVPLAKSSHLHVFATHGRLGWGCDRLCQLFPCNRLVWRRKGDQDCPRNCKFICDLPSVYSRKFIFFFLISA